MSTGMITSQTCPELRTVPKIWICVDPEEKKITSTSGIDGDTTTRIYTDEDFADQLTAAAVEERLK